MDTKQIPPPTYYTVSDRKYFPGTVALLNSLRLTGNAGELVVLDAGLDRLQQRLLAEHATLVTLPHKVIRAFFLKPSVHFFNPSQTIVVIDSDVIVTGSLNGIIERATYGSICAYPDEPYTRWRWFPEEWRKSLQLRAPLSQGLCINTGLLAFSTDHWPGLLSRWWDVCQLITPEEISPSGPFQALDQDALNALLMSEIPREGLHVLPESESGLGAKVGITIEVEDFVDLRCASEGALLRILHFIDRPKPWEGSGWTRLAASDYVRLMQRLLFWDDVTLRMDPRQVPVWVRPSRGGKIALTALGAANRSLIAAVSRFPDPVVEQLRRIRRAIT